MEKNSRSLNRLALCICLAVLLWLADSLLLAFSSGWGFQAALWSAVPPLRLLLRLAICMTLLLYGFIRAIVAGWRYERRRRMSPERHCQLYGSPDSAVRGERLQYHCQRLAVLMHMRPRERENLRLLCYCHDLGLIGVPDRLLDLAGAWGLPGGEPPPGMLRFNGPDQKLYDQHVDIGAEIAASIPELNRAARLICCHEERYDGGGPKSLYGRSIPLACRIFAVARLYDYFTNPHAGGRVMDTAEALDELELYAGGSLDPDVVAAFRRLMTDKRLGAAALQEIYAIN